VDPASRVAQIEAEREHDRDAEIDATDRAQAAQWNAVADAERSASWQPGRVQETPEPAAEPAPAASAEAGDFELEAGG